jgi:ABC-2 type transport system ATP-binding protein
MDAAGVTALSVEVRRPSLDDVFLTLTGRTLRDAEDPAAEPVAERELEEAR